MVSGTKAISPCVKSASARLFPDLHTMSAPSGEERTLEEAAQVERAAWCYGFIWGPLFNRVFSSQRFISL
jgi:hypothetical protein